MGELTCIHFAHEDTSLVKIKATGELKLNDSPVCGEGYFASLEPQSKPASLKRFPPKNPKTGIMTKYGIYYMQGTSYMRIPEELAIKPCQPKGH